MHSLTDSIHPTGRHVPTNRMTDRYRLTSKDRVPSRYDLTGMDKMTVRFSLADRDRMTVKKVYVRHKDWRV
jgi:hypothetical protein